MVTLGAAVAGVTAVGSDDLSDDVGPALGTNIAPGLGVAVTTMTPCPGNAQAIAANARAIRTRIAVKGSRVNVLMGGDYNGLL